MSIHEILEGWGIKVSEDEWYPEYLLNNKRNNFFYIDKLPLSVGVNNAEKFEQVDLFFQKVLEGIISKKQFLSLEIKYRNILTKLWLYNKVFVESTLISNLDIDTNIKKIDKQYLNIFKKIQMKYCESNFLEITQKEDLELLIQIGARDIADTAFCFIEYGLIIVPSWSCFMLYFNDLTKYQVVKDIVASEGLFLRASTLHSDKEE